MRWWWSFNSMVVLLYIYAFLYAVAYFFFVVCSKPTHFSLIELEFHFSQSSS